MSESRIAALKQLIAYRLPIESTIAALATFGWDCEAPLVTLSVHDVLPVLERFLAGDLTAEQLTDWADLIECREDIACADKPIDLSKIVFRLANPNLRGPITVDVVAEIRDRLRSSCVG